MDQPRTSSPDHDSRPPLLDLVVVGAGPCGIAVGAAARKAALDVVLLDKGCITNSLVAYPPYMTFFSTAEKLELERIPFPVPSGKPTRLDALTYYRGIVRHFRIPVRQYEEVTAIEVGTEPGPGPGRFRVRTRRWDGVEGVVDARGVVIATGGFHAPNLLDVPGEELPKVMHEYTEPHPYSAQDVLVVGGSNSAVEASLELWRAGARVTLVHFLQELDRGVKPWVRPDIDNRLSKGDITPRWGTRVQEIRPASVVLREEGTGRLEEIPNQWVFALTGWRPDHLLLKSMGVQVDEGTGIPAHDRETLQTNVAGVYIAGVIAAGYDANKIFIENGRAHGQAIVTHWLESQARPAQAASLRTPTPQR